MYRIILLSLTMLILGACQLLTIENDKKDDSLYQALGGKAGIERIVDIFIYEIGETSEIVHHFEESNIERFREKQIEHICLLSGGPCTYTGDEMLPVHQGMNINEAEFNATADAMIRALNTAGISLSSRNRLLGIIASMRDQVIYQ